MRFTFALFFGLVAFNSAFALPLPPFTSQDLEKYGLMPAVAADPTPHHFEGIVALSNCSGSIIRFENSLDSDQALILTNGHCVKLMGADEVFERMKSSRTFTVLDDEAKNIGSVQAVQLMYATMSKTDVAIYKLQKTYQQIRDEFHVEALTLAKTAPAIDTHINIVSGYWKRGYNCRIEAQVLGLKEDVWSWKDSLRYSRPGCEIIGGTSGSPIIQENTRIVVGVNNTSNEDDQNCTMNNPCEVDAEGKTSHVKGYSYGQQTFWIYSCLNEAREIDTSVEGCLLPKKPVMKPVKRVVPLPGPLSLN